MESFCGSTFWNLNLTWYTEDPDLTPCFQNTVLVWAPCGFLCLLSIFEFIAAFSSRGANIPWAYLNVSKCGISIFLIVLQLLELGYCVYREIYNEGVIYPVDLYTPIIKIITFVLALTLDVTNKRHGIRSSGTIFVFWLLFTLCDIPAFRSAVRNPQAHPKYQHIAVYLLEVMSFPLLVAQLLLNFWADAAPEYNESIEIPERPSPEKGSSFPSRFFFFWFETLSRKGYRKLLKLEDLWDLNPENTTKVLNPTFSKYWERVKKKAARRSVSAGFVYEQDTTTAPRPKKTASILSVFFSAFGSTFLFGTSISLLNDLLAFAPPQLLDLLIGYAGGHEESWKGYLYALLLFLASLLGSLLQTYSLYHLFLVSLRVKSTVVSTIYDKSLRISNAAREEATVGEIVNLMSVDTSKLSDLCMQVDGLWSSSLRIILALYFLWGILGPSVLSGLAVMLFMIPFNAVLVTKIKTLERTQMELKDKRIKLMNEILAGMKVLKLYAWEPSFEKQVLDIRTKEIDILTKVAYLDAASAVIWSCAPVLVSVATFATYVYVDEANVLDAQKAFVSLSLFNIMRIPLTDVPYVIVQVVQAAVSLKRINRFLNSEEIAENSVTHLPDKDGNAVVIQDGNFNWSPSVMTLRNIDLRVKEGALFAVVGSVGAGKSSLLSAILGEMNRVSGRVNVKESCAYVSQQAWIQNSTLRNNVLFGNPFDGVKYDRVIEACALRADLEILPAGDQTEIGERGINLSGGQKQRVALARAAYNYSDLYLLDDVLSAVDAHVGKHLFEKVIGPNGLLKRKTRILVTHGITYLPQMDQIIVLKDGVISESGTYRELLDKKGDFADFLIQHISSETTEDDGDSLILHDLEEVLGPREVLRRSKSQLSETEGQPRKRTTSQVSETESPVRKRTPSRQMSSLSSQTSWDESDIRKPRLMSSPEILAEANVKLTQDRNTLIEAEAMVTGNVRLDVLLHYLKAFGWTGVLVAVVFQATFQGFSVGSNVWLSVWSTSGEEQNGTMEGSERDMFLGVYAGLGLGQGFAILVTSIFLARGTLRAAGFLHKQMLSRIMRAPMTFFDTTPLGRVVNRFAKDVDVADDNLLHGINFWMECFSEVVATVGVICFTTPIFIAIIVPLAILYFLAQRFYATTLRQIKRLESVTRSPIYSHFSETLSGVTTIRAFGAQDRFKQESEARIDQNQTCYYSAYVAGRFLAICIATCGSLVIFFAAIFTAVSAGSLSTGLVGLTVSYAIQVTFALGWLVRMTSEIESNFVSVERLKEYGEIVQEADWEIPDKRPSRGWPEAGEVVFKNYETRYREGLDLVLHDVSCRIEPGERVGIVGRTGAGKSSLTLALFRMIEASGGSISIDGQDISKIGLHDLRRRITVIPQDPTIFAGTIRLNLDPFDEYTDEAVWRALELAHLKPFVNGLDNTLEYELTEGGDNLSQGQRQLVCLTRALLRKKKLFILDEATSGVDLETDALIQETIRAEFNDCTILTIAHRLNTIMDYTRVLVLDRGVICEFDAPANLLKDKNSLFYKMAKDDGLVS